jgi:hypothetical protein
LNHSATMARDGKGDRPDGRRQTAPLSARVLALTLLPARLWAGEIQVINGDAEFPEGPFGRRQLATPNMAATGSAWDGTANQAL